MRRIARWLATPRFGARRAMWSALVTVLTCATLVTFRRGRRDPAAMDPRAAEREHLRYMRARLSEYASTFHRPAYTLDSVSAHLDSADATAFNSLRVNRWGHPVGYWWGPRGFGLISYVSREGPSPRFVVERSGLPEAARGHLNAWGMYVPDHPVIISLARSSSTPARR